VRPWSASTSVGSGGRQQLGDREDDPSSQLHPLGYHVGSCKCVREARPQDGARADRGPGAEGGGACAPPLPRWRAGSSPRGMLCPPRAFPSGEAVVRDDPQQSLFFDPTSHSLRHVVESQQFDRDMLTELFKVAVEMEAVSAPGATGHPWKHLLRGFIMSTLFYEPSTRTRLSFESAMRRLGGTVLTTESAGEYSSAAKGETLEDTIRTVEGYCDCVVLRHFESGASRRAAAASSIPIINAGDGPGQHPTQALLDVYTIQREIGRLDNIRVALVGDLANGRTARSLAYMLSKFNDVEFVFVAPPVVAMGDDIKGYLDSKGVKWSEEYDLLKAAAYVDVIYQTRIQKERFGDRVDDYEAARGKYIVDRAVMDALRPSAIVMHPLPRVDEISVEVDADPRAAYFRQAKNGLFIRMAILKMLLQPDA